MTEGKKPRRKKMRCLALDEVARGVGDGETALVFVLLFTNSDKTKEAFLAVKPLYIMQHTTNGPSPTCAFENSG